MKYLKEIGFSIFIFLIIIQLIRAYIIKRYFVKGESDDSAKRTLDYFTFQFPDYTYLADKRNKKTIERVRRVLKVVFLIGLSIFLLIVFWPKNTI